MKITDIKTFRLRTLIPQDGQVFSRSGVRNYRSTTLVRIDTDEGISGWGSCSGNGELIEFVVARILCPLIVGMDPTRIDDVGDQAYVRGGHKEFGTRGIGVVALSGIDVALWDIVGKLHGQPLYQLLGDKWRPSFQRPCRSAPRWSSIILKILFARSYCGSLWRCKRLNGSPDKPGLGIQVDADALERFALSRVEELVIRHKALVTR